MSTSPHLVRYRKLTAPLAAKLTLAAIGAMVCGCAVQFDSLIQPTVQLDGTWTGTYQCPLGVPQLETIHVARRGRHLIATKLTGDACVPAGFVTWEATLPSSVIGARNLPMTVGVAITEGVAGRPAGRVYGRLTIMSSDRMIIEGAGGIDLTRGTVAVQPVPAGQSSVPLSAGQLAAPVGPPPPPGNVPPPAAAAPAAPVPAVAPAPAGPTTAATVPRAPATQAAALSVPPGRPRCEAPSNNGVTAAELALVKSLSSTVEPEVAKIDLNGDGRPDFFVTDHDCGNMRLCGTTVYLSQGATYLTALATEDGDFDQVDPISVGAGATNGSCDLTTGGFRYSWNGKAYKKNGKAPAAKGPAVPSPAGVRGQPLSFIAKMSQENFTIPLGDDPDVKKRFRAVLGKDFQFFLDRLNGVGGVETRDGFVAGWGCMRHECTVEDAAFVINVATEEIHCAIRSEKFKKTFRVYGRDKEHPPAALTRTMKQLGSP